MRYVGCRANLDRIQLVTKLAAGAAPPDIPGSRVVRDTLVRAQTSKKAYARVREYVNPLRGTRIFVQYQPQLPGLPSLKATIIAVDQRILSREEIWQIVRPFGNYRLLLIELALDFHPNSRVDIGFVRSCAMFGKCRPHRSRMFPNSARYGGRKGDKLVRCYWKEAAVSFRIELELHSAWLRRNGIRMLEDLRKLPRLLYPNHVRFVRVDWIALEKYLSRGRLAPKEVIRRAQAQSDSIHRVMECLRRIPAVHNAHRFLLPLRANHAVQRALKRWAQNY